VILAHINILDVAIHTDFLAISGPVSSANYLLTETDTKKPVGLF